MRKLKYPKYIREKSLDINNNKNQILALIISIIAIIISIFALIQPFKTLTDRNNGRKITIELGKRDALEIYANYVEDVFIENANKIIFYFLNIKGADYVIKNIDKIKYLYYTIVLGNLVNESYYDFFEKNDLGDIYNYILKYNRLDEYRFLEIIYSPNYSISYNNDIIKYYIEDDIKNIDLILDNSIENYDIKKECLIELFDKLRIQYNKCVNEIKKIYDTEMLKGNLDEKYISVYYKLIIKKDRPLILKDNNMDSNFIIELLFKYFEVGLERFVYNGEN
jgi:hypothetical protein